MYKNIYYHKKTNTIHLWDDEKKYMHFPYQKYAYKKDSSGNYVSLFGHKLKKVNSWDKTDLENDLIFESDINPETRTLIDLYYSDDVVSKNINILFIDIEVDGENGYSEAKDAKNEITAITIYDKTKKEKNSFIVNNSETLISFSTDCNIHEFQTEKDLLKGFLVVYQKSIPDIISGWNSDNYDIPYLCNRIKSVLGSKYLSLLSPIGIVEKNDWEEYTIAGISLLDLMSLYKQFTYNEESSYSLDSICRKELGRGKIEYDGNLDDLYKYNINKFCEYNIEDVNLLILLDLKLDHITLARSICHKGHVPYEEISFVSSYLDGASLTYLKNINVIAPNRPKVHKLKFIDFQKKGVKKIFMDNNIPPETPKKGILLIQKTKTSYIKIEYSKYFDNIFYLNDTLPIDCLPSFDISISLPGAFVKDPLVGLHDWVFDLDLTSLYPSIIMTLNISKETKVGSILNWDENKFIRNEYNELIIQIKSHKITYSPEEFTNFIKEKNYSISSCGILYDLNHKGFIPTILELWFNERDDFKTKMKKYGKENNQELYKFYHSRQLTMKVLLNSFYGVMALSRFRFYDMENAQSVTSTGQSIIKFSGKVANFYYNQILGEDDDHLITIDTDSLFLSALPIIQKKYPTIDYNDKTIMIPKVLEVATDVQNYINKSYDTYALKMHNCNQHKLKIKQENISRTGLFIAKKRYALWQIFAEGVPVDKLDVKGLDTVRSDFPKAFKIFMADVLKDILHKISKEEYTNKLCDFKEKFKNLPIQDVMIIKSVKKLSDYDDKSRTFFTYFSGTPGHVKAALSYNDLIKHLKLKYLREISNGMKIKFAYLKKNPYNLESIAFTGFNDPPEIVNFIEKYIDRDKIFDSILENKLQSFYNALNWGLINTNKTSGLFFNF